MKFVRNPEIQRQIILYLLLGGVAVVCAGYFVGRDAAAIVFLSCLVFAALHFMLTWFRYRQIASMSQNLDNILYDETAVLMRDCEEGELAVLYTQLGKLVRRLQEQNGHLKEDKLLLADSLTDISHQLKTPLTSIHLLLSFLKEEEVSVERRREISREIESLIGRIDWLVYALLRMSRLDAGVAAMKAETVSVRELASRAYDLVAVPMDLRGIRWDMQVAEGISFQGDLSWSVEAVSNILKNCMEHTAEGGGIRLTAVENAIFTEILIEDEGTGIAPEDLPHLFERFYRGKGNDSQSVGVGLPLAQRIILQQHGTIQVKNREQGGAAFYIRFYKTVV